MLQTLRLALCALVITAACGGNDPPGGGNNGGTADGGKKPGSDGHVPNPSNPLIQAIPGMWELIAIDYDYDDRGWLEYPVPEERGPVTVDPSDPNCAKTLGSNPQPIGDACINWAWLGNADLFVLQEEAIRYQGFDIRREGRVLNNGSLVEFHQESYRKNTCIDWDGERGLCRDTAGFLRWRKIE